MSIFFPKNYQSQVLESVQAYILACHSTTVRNSVKPLLVPLLAMTCANAKPGELPAAASRSYAQNYKDKVLAACIATAYKNDKAVQRDAAYTSSALNEWGKYDIDASTGKTEEIVNQFLSRPYHSYHGDDVRLDLLKCLDLYHSKELDLQVKKYVIKPGGSFVKDQPPDR